MKKIALIAALALAMTGGTAAVAKKKKHKIPVGVYAGQTVPDGLAVSVTVNPGRTTGSLTYCQQIAPFTITGKTFTVTQVDPVSGDTVSGSGYFNAKKKTVSGSLAANGCTSVPQSFFLNH
jgi:hypothetical protein